MTEEERPKFIKAPKKACEVLDLLINGLIDEADSMVKAKNYDIAYNKFLQIDSMLGFKQARCKGD